MRKRTSLAVTIMILPTLTTAGLAIAQGTQTNGPRPQYDRPPTMAAASTCQLNENEQMRAALVALHAANLDEIAAGKLAQTHAASPEVKQFADRMVQDHTSADTKLTDLARRKNIDLTPPIDRDPIRQAAREASQAMAQHLQSLRGMAFDVSYIAPQAAMHEFVHGIAEQAQNAATDQDIKDTLKGMQQTIKDHHRMVMDLINRLTLQQGGSTGGGPSDMPSSSAAPDSTDKPHKGSRSKK